MKRWIVAMLAAGLLAAGVGEAYAGTTKYATAFVQFTLTQSSGKVSGKIVSATSKCTKGRTVKLIRQHGGNKQTLGKDGTNSDGKFAISFPSGQVKKGTYYAKAKSKTYDNGQKVCQPARSGTITF